MITALWGRIQGIVAALGLVLGAIVSAWFMGRATGGERVRTQAAAREQQVREKADEAARSAERSGASDRLRDGRF